MPFLRHRQLLLSLLALVLGMQPAAGAEEHRFITVASTTSAQQSGLFGHILPVFTQRTGIDVYISAVGTGQALRSGRLGESDVVLVHDRPRELEFMRNGFGTVRREFMYNDFVLVGPAGDPAKVDATHDAAAALHKIAEAAAPFVSRGDTSGTAAAEQRLWREAGAVPDPRRDLWYVETGSSMEQTLFTAASMNAYMLTDRGTWLRFSEKRDLRIVVEGDPRLRNQYSVLLVNPARHPQVKQGLAMAFIEWLTSRDGQATIAAYKIAGEQLFFPNYAPP